MQFKNLLIVIGFLVALVLALALCTGPVVALCGGDFEDVFEKVDGVDTYKYLNLNNPDEKYFKIHCDGTIILHSMVTFKPANIPDAPKMLVYTYKGSRNIFLPQSVDEWEIEYYSRFLHEPNICVEHLKNSGVANIHKVFTKYTEKGLILELSAGQFIYSVQRTALYWNMPSV